MKRFAVFASFIALVLLVVVCAILLIPPRGCYSYSRALDYLSSKDKSLSGSDIKWDEILDLGKPDVLRSSVYEENAYVAVVYFCHNGVLEFYFQAKKGSSSTDYTVFAARHITNNQGPHEYEWWLSGADDMRGFILSTQSGTD